MGERMKKAPIPFTTSTLQQEASKTLNFSTQKTMRLAQQLYEGVDIKGRGTIGLITYLRTDSTRIAEEADAAAQKLYRRAITGQSYVSEAPAAAKSDAKIQDAHEAIRPTDITLTPVHGKGISFPETSSVCTSLSGSASRRAGCARRFTRQPPSR